MTVGDIREKLVSSRRLSAEMMIKRKSERGTGD